MRTPIHIFAHYPATEDGKAELARRVAAVHAEMVFAEIDRLQCPSEQKRKIMDAVIVTAKRTDREKKS